MTGWLYSLALRIIYNQVRIGALLTTDTCIILAFLHKLNSLTSHTTYFTKTNQLPFIMRSSAIAAIALAVGAMASPIVKKQSATIDDNTILNYACELARRFPLPYGLAD